MEIDSVDLNLLRVFDAIMRYGSLTAAAENVGLTQPGASNALTRLRTVFDDSLFVRTTTGMQPTEYAQTIAVPIRQALELLDISLRTKTKFDPVSANRTFHICTTDIGTLTFVPALLERVRAVAPEIKIKIGQYPSRESQEMLASGELDLAVGHLPDLIKGVYQRLLFDDHYVCIAARSHPRIRGSLSFENFVGELHAVASSPGTGHACLLKHLSSPQHKLRVGVEMRDFAAIPTVVANTDLIATVPSRLAGLYESLLSIQVLALPIKLPRFNIALLWHERSHRDPSNLWLRSLFVDLFNCSSGTAYRAPMP